MFILVHFSEHRLFLPKKKKKGKKIIQGMSVFGNGRTTNETEIGQRKREDFL